MHNVGLSAVGATDAKAGHEEANLIKRQSGGGGGAAILSLVILSIVNR